MLREASEHCGDSGLIAAKDRALIAHVCRSVLHVQTDKRNKEGGRAWRRGLRARLLAAQRRKHARRQAVTGRLWQRVSQSRWRIGLQKDLGDLGWNGP